MSSFYRHKTDTKTVSLLWGVGGGESQSLPAGNQASWKGRLRWAVPSVQEFTTHRLHLFPWRDPKAVRLPHLVRTQSPPLSLFQIPLEDELRSGPQVERSRCKDVLGVGHTAALDQGFGTPRPHCGRSCGNSTRTVATTLQACTPTTRSGSGCPPPLTGWGSGMARAGPRRRLEIAPSEPISPKSCGRGRSSRQPTTVLAWRPLNLPPIRRKNISWRYTEWHLNGIFCLHLWLSSAHQGRRWELGRNSEPRPQTSPPTPSIPSRGCSLGRLLAMGRPTTRAWLRHSP